MNNLISFVTLGPVTGQDNRTAIIPPYKPDGEPTELILIPFGKRIEHLSSIAEGVYALVEGRVRIERNQPPELSLSAIYEASPHELPTLTTITLVGHVGQEPEVRYLGSGSVVANLTLAVNRPEGKRTPETPPDWFSLAVWGKQAQVVADYVAKGSRLGVIGSFAMDFWIDKATNERRSKPVVRVNRLELLGKGSQPDGGAYDG